MLIRIRAVALWLLISEVMLENKNGKKRSESILYMKVQGTVNNAIWSYLCDFKLINGMSVLHDCTVNELWSIMILFC